MTYSLSLVMIKTNSLVSLGVRSHFGSGTRDSETATRAYFSMGF